MFGFKDLMRLKLISFRFPIICDTKEQIDKV